MWKDISIVAYMHACMHAYVERKKIGVFSQHTLLWSFYSNCIQSRPWWHCIWMAWILYVRAIVCEWVSVQAIQYAWWWRYDDLHLSNRKRIWITFTLTDGGHAHERFRISFSVSLHRFFHLVSHLLSVSCTFCPCRAFLLLLLLLLSFLRQKNYFTKRAKNHRSQS